MLAGKSTPFHPCPEASICISAPAPSSVVPCGNAACPKPPSRSIELEGVRGGVGIALPKLGVANEDAGRGCPSQATPAGEKLSASACIMSRSSGSGRGCGASSDEGVGRSELEAELELECAPDWKLKGDCSGQIEGLACSFIRILLAVENASTAS